MERRKIAILCENRKASTVDGNTDMEDLGIIPVRLFIKHIVEAE